MAWFDNAQRELLAGILERRLDLTHKGNPRLRPLSLYTSELKNAKQLAMYIDKIENGQPLAAKDSNSKRYRNTLLNYGLLTTDPSGVDCLNDGGKKIIDLIKKDDGTPEYWRLHSQAVDRISVQQQIAHLRGGKNDAVEPAWCEVFYNVQELIDHAGRDLLLAALDEEDLKEIEALQYMNSVGTEPWRYSRLKADDRLKVQDLMLTLPAKRNAGQQPDAGSELESAAVEYSKAISGYQRDVRYRVAGFVQAYLELQQELGPDFPRMTPDGVATFSGNRSAAKPKTATTTPSVKPLSLPLQLIISGCPGSGKSHFAETAATGADVVRTQFHSDTSFASFVGSFRPVPVYQTSHDVVELSGHPFARGKPLIDYRFVPGPALEALVAARQQPDRNIVLLIEELNRANAAAAFGELFQLLDRQADGTSRYGINLPAEMQSWLVAADALVDGERLHLPSNLYIWATMNSGDQGVFPIDTAFRRRWAYRYLGYAQPCEYPAVNRRIAFGGHRYDWDELRGCINRKLKQLNVNEDRLIGPYFLTQGQIQDPAEVLSKLLLYLWDDVLRFRQHELFRSASFAEVSEVWSEGSGNPLQPGILDHIPDVSQQEAPGPEVAANEEASAEDLVGGQTSDSDAAAVDDGI